MSVVIRETDIDEDRKRIIDFLYEHLTKRTNEQFLDWRYKDNPYGKARIWIAHNGGGENEMVGVAAALPRLMRVCGDDLICWNLADFVVSSGFRSLGPALMLQRACVQPALKGEIPFCYDHPNNRMAVIYKRMGVSPAGEVLRFAKPLRIDRKVNEFVGEGILARGLSGLGNLFLGVKDAKSRLYEGYEVATHEGRFGGEFSELDAKVSGHYKVCGRRTAEYLNWRYLDNPFYRYETVTLRRDGELLSYTVFHQDEQDVMVSELFGIEETETTGALLAALFGMLRERGIFTLSVPSQGSSRMASLLKVAGFYPRESSSMFVCTQPGGSLDGVVNGAQNWFLTHGDRDI